MNEVVCVFCSASEKINLKYHHFTQELVEGLVQIHCKILYGGDLKGLMKVVAQTTKEYHGYLIVVIPKFLCLNNLACDYCNELILVDSLYERKSIMGKQATVFLALP